MKINLPYYLKKADYYKKNPESWKNQIPQLKSGICQNRLLAHADLPLVSIITVVKNGVATLERTIQSVLKQTYKSIEYIIIDGGSSDKTGEIIQKYRTSLSLVVCEPDNGIGEAFNKGISYSQGEIIGILNSDDWYEPGAVEAGVKALQASTHPIAHGPMMFHDLCGNIVLYDGNHDLLPFFNSVNHPTVFARRQCFEENGLFRSDFRFSFDYEWLLRFQRRGGRFVRYEQPLSHMSSGGLCTRSWEIVAAENFLIRDRYGIKPMSNMLLYLMQFGQKVIRFSSEKLGLLPWLGVFRQFCFKVLAPEKCPKTTSEKAVMRNETGKQPKIAIPQEVKNQP